MEFVAAVDGYSATYMPASKRAYALRVVGWAVRLEGEGIYGYALVLDPSTGRIERAEQREGFTCVSRSIVQAVPVAGDRERHEHYFTLRWPDARSLWEHLVAWWFGR